MSRIFNDDGERAVRLALIEDEAPLRQLFLKVLEPLDLGLAAFESGEEFLASGSPSRFDIVLTDLQMAGMSGIEVLRACRSEPEPPEVLLITGFGSIANAVEAMRMGAFDYVSKPIGGEELRHRVKLAIESVRLRREIQALDAEVKRRDGPLQPVAESAVMKECLTVARQVADSSSTVLILGETGTGKDFIARHIQAKGPRAEKPYLTLNCAALPDDLVENELFGHARGAFPGAGSTKRGLFEEADGGTLFLDEIGAMSDTAQAKLLRVLEDGVVRRLGDTRSFSVDVRILAATNRDLEEAAGAGDFRPGLFYRLSVVTLKVPPLRERLDDIEPLARHFLAEACRRIGKMRIFSPETPDFLRSYHYPGNVRELRSGIEQAVTLSRDAVLRPADFAFSRRLSDRFAYRPGGRPGLRPAPLREQITPELIQRVLREQRGNRVRTAKALGISRATLYRMLDRSASHRADQHSAL
jgi:DNA-binding NtrC family response regulator